MNKIVLENNEYEIIKDYKNGYNKEELEEKYTDYFNDFDYIVGDWAYGKLRLKGFCDKKNTKFKPINDIAKAEEYIKTNGAYDCRYFIIKKIDN